MRAFLSTFERRQTRIGDGYASDRAALAAMAVREARRILAETERGTLPCEARNLPHQEKMALMEALPGFIGQTFSGERCRCVQGLHWSPERGYFECNGVAP